MSNPIPGPIPGPLAGIRVFDLTRILAGPSAMQLLGDLGADIIKIERPGQGDDTRKWGPPYIKDADGNDTTESAYYLCANRNKRSVTLDISKPEGQALAKKLIAQCDVLVENYKTGGLAKYGLDYASLKQEFPRLVYCSVTGFGQTGPYAERAGYDFVAQGLGGIMSITGEPEGEPVKVGVGIADLMCGMHSAVAILAALRHRDATGEGQHIDACLLDTQVSWLVNEATNYLVSGQVPARRGNAHPNIVPYQVFKASDGYIILACGNDGQYQRFCAFAQVGHLASDPRFLTNPDRIRNREELIPLIQAVTATQPVSYWVDGLERCNVPCSPVNRIDQVFEDPQVKARDLTVQMDHPLSPDPVTLLAYPLKLSGTPATYRLPPPLLGQHTDDILSDMLEMTAEDIAALREKGVV